MHQRLIRWVFVFAACAFLACGSASGIKPGIPDDTTAAPVNPTPDMGPSTKPTRN